MRILLKLLIFFFPAFLQSQELPIDKLLLTKNYVESKQTNNALYGNDFSQKNLISKVSDSIIVYNSSKSTDANVIDKEVGSCLILNFAKKDYLEIIAQLNFLNKQGYHVFKDDNQSDYKKYLEFISRGLIISTVPGKNQIILIYVNTCVFLDNKNKLIKNIKNIDLLSDSYVFNCGGKQIFQKVK
ncbi:hypothetical protein [Flavobacterium sp. ov086]|uniref:hypothetical protein n=1 Tax=Flavobacterium sp. ov086 TaxID=1761785 RepID=UPI000B6EFCE2|nr:hypothetical protein [Flavobacterium sp. ov086]SNR77389.1 hypothetical protein SAMN04487979_12089 [Flavobacterium sp. ov086]